MTLHKLTGNQAIEAASGNNSGMTSINKFGRNEEVDIATEEEIWDGSIAYSFPATALMTSISQTADQAALNGGTIEIQGLDANWDLVTQTATLGTPSTTVVTLTTPLIRCFRMKVLENVVTTSPIRVHNAGETVDYAIIGVGNNQTQMAIYTVPAGKTAYMTNYYSAVNPATNKDPTSNTIRLWATDNANGYARQIKHVHGLTVGQHQHHFDPYYRFTEKTDIFITATPVFKAADVSAGFDLIVVDE
jgi:hypothetical protein